MSVCNSTETTFKGGVLFGLRSQLFGGNSGVSFFFEKTSNDRWPKKSCRTKLYLPKW